MIAGRGWWKLGLLHLILVNDSHSYTVLPVSNNHLNARTSGNTCDDGLPSTWVCSTSTVCIPLNNTGTQAAICCPTADDSRCSTVAPISCDISLQDAATNPHSSLFTQDLSQQLTSCGKNTCCPLGYSCSGGNCVMDEQTKEADQSQSSTAVPATSSQAAGSATTNVPGSAATSSVSSPDSPGPCQQTPVPFTRSVFPAQAVLAGFFPGIILGALICACIFFLLRRRSMKRMAQDIEADDGHFGHTPGGGIVRASHLRPSLMRSTRHKHKISDPIYDHSLSNRSVFIKHSRGSPEMGKNPLPRTPSRSKRWYRSPRLGMGTWDTNSTIVGQQTPEHTVRPRLNVVTPTPPPRNHSTHRHLTPSVPGLAVTTKNGGRVSNLLKPLSPSFQRAKNFGTLSPRAKSPTLPEFQIPTKAGAVPSRSNSNDSATTIASRSTSGKGHSRRSTNASTGTIDFLLAPHTGPAGGTFPFSGSPPQSKDKGKAVVLKTPQRTPPRLGAPWQTPTILESPDRQNFESKENRPVTTFTTLMLDAGYKDGSPAKAIRRM